MGNPWLSIPLSDYEGHMSDVGQLEVLSDLFAEVLGFVQPVSVAVLGVAGGNGLERIDGSVTRRVAGVDIRPEYLDAARARRPEIETHCCDLANGDLRIEPVHLVHAALIFEHAGTERCLENAVRLVERGGYLSTVLQLPSATASGVTETPFPSVQRLKEHFRFIEPDALRAALDVRGFELVWETHTPVPGGKSFWTGVFRSCSAE